MREGSFADLDIYFFVFCAPSPPGSIVVSGRVGVGSAHLAPEQGPDYSWCGVNVQTSGALAFGNE